jgi:biotin operon repressor
MTRTRSMGDGNWYWVNKALLRDHAKDIGALGVAVYSCLASFVDANQTCYPTQDQIGEILGYSRPSINKAIKLLEQRGLITVDKRGRHNCVYHLVRVRCKVKERQQSSTGTLDVKRRNTNDNHITRINNDTEVIHRNVAAESKFLQPLIQNEILAMELADALNDRRNLSLYLSYSRKYPESLLRGVIREVQEVPSGKIRKSRAALFNHLIQLYGKYKTKNPGD